MTRPRESLDFVKLHGAGNDYVVVSALADSGMVAIGSKWAARLSDRHFGIGGDGLIIVERGDRADFRMHMWNADGSRGALCGNGLRCAAKLVYDTGAASGPSFTIESDVGVHPIDVEFDANGRVIAARVEIGPVQVEPAARVMSVAGTSWRVIRGSAGNPHAVVFVDHDVAEIDVDRVGRAFQSLPEFRGGVNVEFVRAHPPNRLDQRTYERGSGETLACGSGATTAACAALVHRLLTASPVTVRLRGGEVSVEQLEGNRFALRGPVATAFSGSVRIAP